MVPSAKPEAARSGDTPAKGVPRAEPVEKPEDAALPTDDNFDLLEDDDDKPLPDVPTLPRVNDSKSSNARTNGSSQQTDEKQDEKDA
jgi:hypothetical protein